MMVEMPRPRPPHLQRQVTQHGKVVWYVRIGRGPRVRIRGKFGTPEFDEAYQAALSGGPRATKGAPDVGTLAWLIARYRETIAWATLSAATRRQRENIFLHVIGTAGNEPISKIAAAIIVAGRERRVKTPRTGAQFPGRHAWPVPLSARSAGGQDRSDGRREKSEAEKRSRLPQMDRARRRGL